MLNSSNTTNNQVFRFYVHIFDLSHELCNVTNFDEEKKVTFNLKNCFVSFFHLVHSVISLVFVDYKMNIISGVHCVIITDLPLIIFRFYYRIFG